MSKSKSYCGVGDPPKKKKRGSAKQCVEKNQIRYWGIKKLPSSVVKSKAFIKLVSGKKIEDLQFKLKAKEQAIKTLFKKFKEMPEEDKKQKKEKKKIKEKLKVMMDEYKAKKKKYEDLKAGK